MSRFNKSTLVVTGEPADEKAMHDTMREAFALLIGPREPIWARRCYSTEPGMPYRLRLELTADFQLRLVAFNSKRVIASCPLEAE